MSKSNVHYVCVIISVDYHLVIATCKELGLLLQKRQEAVAVKK